MDTIILAEQYKTAHKQYRDGLESPLVVYRYLMQLKLYQEMGKCENQTCNNESTYLADADKGVSIYCDRCKSETYWFKTQYT